MSWCPKCKEEYIGGIIRCPECGSGLIKAPKDAAAGEPGAGGDGLITEHMEEKLLFTVENEVQLALITDALKKENIPFSTSAQKLWDHMQIIYKQTVVGEEVYVAEKDYGRAKEIYDYFEGIKDSFEEEE